MLMQSQLLMDWMCWAEELQVGDEVWHQRSTGEIVRAIVAEICLKSGTCRVEYNMPGGQLRKLLRVEELFQHNQPTKVVAEQEEGESLEEEVDPDQAFQQEDLPETAKPFTPTYLSDVQRILDSMQMLQEELQLHLDTGDVSTMEQPAPISSESASTTSQETQDADPPLPAPTMPPSLVSLVADSILSPEAQRDAKTVLHTTVVPRMTLDLLSSAVSVAGRIWASQEKTGKKVESKDGGVPSSF